MLDVVDTFEGGLAAALAKGGPALKVKEETIC
jgi:hypothetical protein